MDDEKRKQILTKCIHESLNRHIHSEVKKVLMQMEQSQSVQPMLVANPSALALTIRQQNDDLSQSEVAQKHAEYLNQLD